ncbi:MAG: ABC transporter ATP-binding protein [Lachnospiraceae bacterium]
MTEATGDGTQVTQLMETFEKLVKEGCKLQEAYNTSIEYAESARISIDSLLIDLMKKDVKLVKEDLKQLNAKLDAVYNEFVVTKEDSGFQAHRAVLTEALQTYAGENSPKLRTELEALQAQLSNYLNLEEPDFFAMGYYVLQKEKSTLLSLPRTEMNQLVRTYINDKFLNQFQQEVAQGLKQANACVQQDKERVVQELKQQRAVFEETNLDSKKCKEAIKQLDQAVNKSIDRLAIHKDSEAYTFTTTMTTNCTHYFRGRKKNPKELKRVERQELKRQKKIKKNADAGKVVPAVLVDLELTRQNLLHTVDGLMKLYENQLSRQEELDYGQLAKDMIAYLEETAYAMVYKVTKQMAYDKAIRIMEDVGIAEPHKRFRQYPFEFSGGMRQRIVIAIAIAANPDILICDEPTTALDVTIQSQILELINELKVKRQLTVIFITHDLGVVANMADQVAVMYAGQIVETGSVDEVFYEPAHPYTWALLSSMPDLDTKEKLESIQGTPPNMIYPPIGDAFAARNKYAMQIDFEKQPPMFRITDTHYAATWLLHKDAPKLDPPKSVMERIERMKRAEVQGNE